MAEGSSQSGTNHGHIGVLLYDATDVVKLLLHVVCPNLADATLLIGHRPVAPTAPATSPCAPPIHSIPVACAAAASTQHKRPRNTWHHTLHHSKAVTTL